MVSGLGKAPQGVDRSVTCLPLLVQSPRNGWRREEGRQNRNTDSRESPALGKTVPCGALIYGSSDQNSEMTRTSPTRTCVGL